MNIYIPVEVKLRELESKLLLALEAAQRGHEVVIGPPSLVSVWGPLGLLKPGILHDKSLHHTVDLPRHKALVKNKNLVTALDEESGILDSTYDYFARIRFSEESLNTASHLFCWGNFDERSLRRIFPNHIDKFINTGSPRVDLWMPKFKSLYAELNKHDEDLNGDSFVLIPSSLGYPMNQNQFWKLQGHHINNKFFEDVEEEYQEYDRAAYETVMLKEFVKMIRALARRFPAETFVVRPHPIENISGWRTLIGELPNVKVIRRGSINAWVNKAKLVIHNGCTTGFEARVNGKNVIAFRPNPSEEFELAVPNQVSFNTFDQEELEKAVDKCLSDPDYQLPYDEKANEILNSRLRLDNENFAFQRIVDRWEAMDAPHLSDGNNWPYLRSRFILSNLKKAIFKLIKKEKGSKAKTGLDISHKFPSLSMAEVLDYQRFFSAEFPEFGEVRVRKVYDKTFVLSK